MQKSFSERFFEKVNKTDSCWLFTGSLNRLGYGQMNWLGKGHKAHRVSWQLHFGAIPANLCVLHRCDVRNCVNPDHLFLGTQQDNIADMVAKNRQRSGCQQGVANPMTKLSEVKVKAIRWIYAQGKISQAKLATSFHVAPMTVNRIVNNRLWRHV